MMGPLVHAGSRLEHARRPNPSSTSRSGRPRAGVRVAVQCRSRSHVHRAVWRVVFAQAYVLRYPDPFSQTALRILYVDVPLAAASRDNRVLRAHLRRQQNTREQSTDQQAVRFIVAPDYCIQSPTTCRQSPTSSGDKTHSRVAISTGVRAKNDLRRQSTNLLGCAELATLLDL